MRVGATRRGHDSARYDQALLLRSCHATSYRHARCIHMVYVMVHTSYFVGRELFQKTDICLCCFDSHNKTYPRSSGRWLLASPRWTKIFRLQRTPPGCTSTTRAPARCGGCDGKAYDAALCQLPASSPTYYLANPLTHSLTQLPIHSPNHTRAHSPPTYPPTRTTQGRGITQGNATRPHRRT